MENSSKDTFEKIKKNSEKRSKKLKSTGKAISYLYLALFFGVGILAAQGLGLSLGWYRIAGMLIIVLVFSFLSILIEKKTRGIEKYSTSSKLIRLLVTILMFLSVFIFYRLTSSI